MKWRNSKERELLSKGESREVINAKNDTLKFKMTDKILLVKKVTVKKSIGPRQKSVRSEKKDDRLCFEMPVPIKKRKKKDNMNDVIFVKSDDSSTQQHTTKVTNYVKKKKGQKGGL